MARCRGDHEAHLMAWLDLSPQENGLCHPAALIPAMLFVLDRHDLPLQLTEPGSKREAEPRLSRSRDMHWRGRGAGAQGQRGASAPALDGQAPSPAPRPGADAGWRPGGGRSRPARCGRPGPVPAAAGLSGTRPAQAPRRDRGGDRSGADSPRTGRRPALRGAPPRPARERSPAPDLPHDNLAVFPARDATRLLRRAGRRGRGRRPRPRHSPRSVWRPTAPG